MTRMRSPTFQAITDKLIKIIQFSNISLQLELIISLYFGSIPALQYKFYSLTLKTSYIQVFISKTVYLLFKTFTAHYSCTIANLTLSERQNDKDIDHVFKFIYQQFR